MSITFHRIAASPSQGNFRHLEHYFSKILNVLKLALFSLSISIRFYGEKISLTPGLENFYFLMYAHIIHMTSMCVCVCVSHSVISNSLQPLGLSRTRLHHPWNSPGKNTGVGCLSLLQGIFPTRDVTQVSLNLTFLKLTILMLKLLFHPVLSG